LAGTDGIWDNLFPGQIEEIVRDTLYKATKGAIDKGNKPWRRSFVTDSIAGMFAPAQQLYAQLMCLVLNSCVSCSTHVCRAQLMCVVLTHVCRCLVSVVAHAKGDGRRQNEATASKPRRPHPRLRLALERPAG